MFGSTNSQNIIQSGGGGDTVYAINNTGADIVAGQKVWLNKHNLDENVAYQYNDGARETNFLVRFDDDDNFLMYNLQGNDLDFYITYNTDAKNWDLEQLSNKPSEVNSPAFMRVINNESIAYTAKTIGNTTAIRSGLVDRDRATTYTGIYLGGGYLVSYVSAGNYKLNTPSSEYSLTGFNGYLTSAYKDGQKMFVMDVNGNYKVYEFNEFFEGAPSVIKEKTNTVFKNNYPIWHFTGLNSGDYVFFSSGAGQNGYQATALNILQFDDDYNLVEPTNLPEDLRALIGQNAFVQYYNNFKILTVGTSTNVYMYKFENGIFTNMNIAIQLPTESAISTDAGVYRLFISKDMTSAVITYRKQTSTYVYFASGWYKLKTASEDWYADTYLQFSSNTLTGMATGKTNEKGRYEVNTVLPKICNLTLNITPDIADNEIVFEGEANDY